MNKRFLDFLPIFLILFGTIKLIFIKYIDKKSFDNPFVQTYFMFFGESLCYVLYTFFSKNRYDKISIIKHTLILIIPTLLDTLSTILVYKAIALTDLSEFQLLKTFNLVLIKIFSYFLYSTKITFIQLSGLLIITGNCIYIIYCSFNSNEDTVDKDPSDYFNDKKYGLIMVIICQFLSCFQLVYEEYFLKCLKENDYSHLYIVGIEGVIGQIFLLTGLTVQSFMGNSLVDFSELFDILNENSFLYPIIFVLILLICVDHGASMYIIKELTSVSRIIIDIIKILLITSLSLLFRFEEINREKMISFNILLFGLIMYGSENLKKEENEEQNNQRNDINDSESDSENQQYERLIN